jgi:phage head maturation protease
VTEFVRAVALDDIRIRKGGSGRVVEAYAAIFDEPAEIVDLDGHYIEVNARGAFNQTIKRNGGRFPVVYHHGMTLAGTPSERGSVPIGVSTDVTIDAKGVLTVAEYGTSELADEVLDAIRMGSIRAQSYGGHFIKSDPMLRAGQRFRPGVDGKLRTVRRLEVQMREFGPTPFPAFTGAAITGVRADLALAALIAAPAGRRMALLDQLSPPLEENEEPDSDDTGTPGPDGAQRVPDQTEEPPSMPSARSLHARIRAFKIAKGLE